MKLALVAATAALMAAAPASATVAFVDFENVTGFAPVGTVSGLQFGGSLLGLVNDGLGNGPNGEYFTNAPSPVGVMFVADDADAVMNVAGGFGSFSFWYSSTDRVAGGVEVWSGLDGAGDLLGSFDLSANATDGCKDSPFCNFERLEATFAEMARSVTFGKSVGAVAFDNFAIPEPTSALLAALALGGLLASRRRA